MSLRERIAGALDLRVEDIPEGLAVAQVDAEAASPATDQARRWEGTIALLDQQSSDGRILAKAGMTVRDLPLPLMAMFGGGAHGMVDPVLVGAMDVVDVRGDTLYAAGWFDATPDGDRALQEVADEVLRYVSVDTIPIEYEVVDNRPASERQADDLLDPEDGPQTEDDVPVDGEGRPILEHGRSDEILFTMVEWELTGGCLVPGNAAFADAQIQPVTASVEHPDGGPVHVHLVGSVGLAGQASPDGARILMRDGNGDLVAVSFGLDAEMAGAVAREVAARGVAEATDVRRAIQGCLEVAGVHAEFHGEPAVVALEVSHDGDTDVYEMAEREPIEGIIGDHYARISTDAAGWMPPPRRAVGATESGVHPDVQAAIDALMMATAKDRIEAAALALDKRIISEAEARVLAGFTGPVPPSDGKVDPVPPDDAGTSQIVAEALAGLAESITTGNAQTGQALAALKELAAQPRSVTVVKRDGAGSTTYEQEQP